MADSIKLTDPAGNDRPVVPKRVTMVFFSGFLSPPTAQSNVIYQGAIRSFRQKPRQVVDMLGEHIMLLKLTLPREKDTLQKEIWVNVEKIEETRKVPDGTVIKLDGQGGTVTVLEDKQFIEDAINSVAS